MLRSHKPLRQGNQIAIDTNRVRTKSTCLSTDAGMRVHMHTAGILAHARTHLDTYVALLSGFPRVGLVPQVAEVPHGRKSR